MKFLFTALFVTLPTNAFAHTGHVETVAEHTHTLAELATMNPAPIVAVSAVVGLAYWYLARRNG